MRDPPGSSAVLEANQLADFYFLLKSIGDTDARDGPFLVSGGERPDIKSAELSPPMFSLQPIQPALIGQRGTNEIDEAGPA